ncbi:MAG: biotin--[Lachnospiraceae bacterium]|nr:biotin--[acetyl-CoA-carboxylase] ligase [Lachnospiraceae bacterium]
MNTKESILRRLRAAEDYLSGQQISRELGISRAAVWKSIGKLKEEGYPIEAVTNKGYRLLSMDTEDTDLFNGAEITAHMHTFWAGHPLYFAAQTGSTNEDILRLSGEGSPQGTVAVTAVQTAGKGRRGRTWISPDGNIYMSILLKPHLPAPKAPMLTLVMALSVLEAVRGLSSLGDSYAAASSAAIKWPNDIVMPGPDGQYRKICGILTEMRMEETEIRDIVIGIGINVNQTEFPEEIRETASSLRCLLGRIVNRSLLTARVWERFEDNCNRFLEAESFTPLKERYEDALVNRGREVRVLDPRGPYTGTALGINEDGALLVRLHGGEAEEGTVRAIDSGEVSVRGTGGYV